MNGEKIRIQKNAETDERFVESDFQYNMLSGKSLRFNDFCKILKSEKFQ
jgi:hypothetical protein